MKKFSVLFAVVIAVVALGCASLQQASFNTLAALSTTVEAARQGFVAYENDCHCVTQAQHDQIANIYVKYQAAMKVAQDAEIVAQASGNLKDFQAALISASADAADVISLIEQFKKPASK